jgi:EAL domain-containing protein (putative c-di-GMP-specific phosphodiesterase class I)
LLVAAIIDLANYLGLRTGAEGIERPTQRARREDMHCDLGRGYHVGKPMPPDQVVDLLAVERGKHRAVDAGWAS